MGGEQDDERKGGKDGRGDAGGWVYRGGGEGMKGRFGGVKGAKG